MAQQDNWQKLLVAGAAAAAGGVMLSRFLIKKTANSLIHRVMVDPYDENVSEFASASRRVGMQNIVETNLRAQKGKVIQRPLGSPRSFPKLDTLMFNTAQLEHLPENVNVPLDLGAVIGPKAQHPLKIDLPIMVSGMAYGLALSEKVKVALAKGTAKAGTATNTGEGPFLQSERDAADKLIIQYTKYDWYKEQEILKQADAIEIHLGQGATGGIGHRVIDKDLLKAIKKKMPIPYRDEVISAARFPGTKNTKNRIPKLVSELRKVTGGVPIGAKLAAGQNLERDLDIIVDAGVDYVVICGAEAATHGSPPIIQDDFGIPTLHAITRAGKYFREHGLKGKVSLIASGGLFSPGHVMKVLALGADAAYIGSIALFAVAHTQVLKSLPWEPPTQVVWADGKQASKFNVNKGAKSIYKYLLSAGQEMEEGLRALGKRTTRDLALEDLCSYDRDVAAMVGIPFSGVKP